MPFGSSPAPEPTHSGPRWEEPRDVQSDHGQTNARLSMSNLLYFEDLRVGDVWKSPSRTITETDVVNFAGLTGDYDPLHVDHEFARQTPYRRPIAHGLLGLSFVAGLSSNHPQVRTMAFISIQSWEFRQPMFIGDTVHAVTEILEKREAGRRNGHVIWKRQLLNQSAGIVQCGIFETLVALATPNVNRRGVNPKRADE